MTNETKPQNPDVQLLELVLRCLWMVIKIVAVLWVGQKGAHFLYQQF